MGDKVSKAEDDIEEQTTEERRVKTHKFKELHQSQFRTSALERKSNAGFDGRRNTPVKTSQLMTSHNLSNRLLGAPHSQYDLHDQGRGPAAAVLEQRDFARAY